MKDYLICLDSNCIINKNNINIYNEIIDIIENINESIDLAIIYSTNEAKEEIEKTTLVNYISYFYSLENMTKEECISNLTNLGYSHDKILMMGNSIDYLKISNNNNILYYSIKENNEVECFKIFNSEILELFLEGDYYHNKNEIITEKKKTPLIFEDENGNPVVCYILFAYHSEAFNKNYFFFYNGENEIKEVAVAEISDDNEFLDIANEEELKELHEVLNRYINEYTKENR